MFTTPHIFYLICSVIFIVASLIFLIKKNISKEKFFNIAIVIAVGCEVFKAMYFSYIGGTMFNGDRYYLPKNCLPLHLCSIQIIFMLILKFSKNEKLKRTLLSFMYPSLIAGGIMALLIPTTLIDYGKGVISVEYFLFHSMIIVFGLYIAIKKLIPLNFKDFTNSLIVLCCLFVFSIYTNGIIGPEYHPNFMYVTAPPIEGLPFLNLNKGWFVYLIRLAFVSLAVVFVAYFPFMFRKENKEVKQLVK